MQLSTLTRSRPAALLVGLAVALALGLGVASQQHHATTGDYPLTITLASSCRNPEPVRVSGRTWQPTDAVPHDWTGATSGTFRIESSTDAVFLGSNGGIEHFQLLRGGFSDLRCMVD